MNFIKDNHTLLAASVATQQLGVLLIAQLHHYIGVAEHTLKRHLPSPLYTQVYCLQKHYSKLPRTTLSTSHFVITSLSG